MTWIICEKGAWCDHGMMSIVAVQLARGTSEA